MQAVLDWLRAGSPPHYVYLAAFGLLMADDMIARSRLRENSVFQMVHSAIGYLLSIPPLSFAAAAINAVSKRKDQP